MILQPAGLDLAEVEALRTDRYLEALLAAAERHAADAPADPDLDPAIRDAARRLRDELVRIHPLFRFEERLARRLAEAASRMRLAPAVGETAATVVPFPAPHLADPDLAGELANPALAALVAAAAGHADGATLEHGGTAELVPGRLVIAHPLLVGGALTSAALSLAGAAFVAWRRTRSAPADPMARAVRAARAARGPH